MDKKPEGMRLTPEEMSDILDNDMEYYDCYDCGVGYQQIKKLCDAQLTKVADMIQGMEKENPYKPFQINSTEYFQSVAWESCLNTILEKVKGSSLSLTTPERKGG